jgi:hypothetical protein
MWGDPKLDWKTSIKISEDRNGLVAPNHRGGRRKHSLHKTWMTHFKTPYATVARDRNDYQLIALRAVSSDMSHVIVVYVSPQLARSLVTQKLCVHLLLLQITMNTNTAALAFLNTDRFGRDFRRKNISSKSIPLLKQFIWNFFQGTSHLQEATDTEEKSHVFNETSGTAIQSGTVICCWPSPAQSFLVSGPVGTHDHISVPSNTVYVF